MFWAKNSGAESADSRSVSQRSRSDCARADWAAMVARVGVGARGVGMGMRIGKNIGTRRTLSFAKMRKEEIGFQKEAGWAFHLAVRGRQSGGREAGKASPDDWDDSRF